MSSVGHVSVEQSVPAACESELAGHEIRSSETNKQHYQLIRTCPSLPSLSQPNILQEGLNKGNRLRTMSTSRSVRAVGRVAGAAGASAGAQLFRTVTQLPRPPLKVRSAPVSTATPLT